MLTQVIDFEKFGALIERSFFFKPTEVVINSQGVLIFEVGCIRAKSGAIFYDKSFSIRRAIVSLDQQRLAKRLSGCGDALVAR